MNYTGYFARCWCYEVSLVTSTMSVFSIIFVQVLFLNGAFFLDPLVQTGVAVGKEIDDDLDINVCDACFAPDYQLHIENPMKNLNTDVDIAKIK